MLTPQTTSDHPEPLILAEPERPFWGFAEILVVLALFLPAVFIGGGIVAGAARLLDEDPRRGLPIVLAEFVGYLIVFAVLRVLFLRYRRPLLVSLGWVRHPFQDRHLVVLGVSLSLLVILLNLLLRTPNIETPLEKLLSDPASRWAIAIFGISLGPIIEELLFRGFLQPVFVAVIGVLPGILLTSALFGAVHLMQNAWMWQSGLLIMLVGFTLGVVRHVSGSTRASAIVHISYNSVPFLMLLARGSSPVQK